MVRTKNPILQLGINYPTAPDSHRKYRDEFEAFFDILPIIDSNEKMFKAEKTLEALSMELLKTPWLDEDMPLPGERDRITLGLGWAKEGMAGDQVVIGRWGKGFITPIHGHAAGFSYEQVLFGKILEKQYELVSEGKVRLIRERILMPGDKHVAFDTQPGMTNQLHTIEALEDSATLNFLSNYMLGTTSINYEII